jgi:hypothetical protein
MKSVDAKTKGGNKYKRKEYWTIKILLEAKVI